jgi:predicted glycosyltransferase
MTKPRTILFQPLNHLGLGHVSRLAAIALAIRQMDPLIRVLFAVEDGGHVLLEALGLPYVVLPSEHAVKETDSWASWDAHERSLLAAEVSRAILKSVRAELVVFDCVPNRALVAESFGAGVPAVLCLREMREMSKYLELMRDILPKIELILVPHNPGAFELPEPPRGKAQFVGVIVRPSPTTELPKRDASIKRIVISGGGGGHPGTVEFYNCAMKAIGAVRERQLGIEARLIAGPLFHDWLKLDLQTGVRVIPFEPDMPGTFAAADLVICQAGYNTIAELERAGTRAIVVPAERPWDDQFARAERTARAHTHLRVVASASQAALAELVANQLSQPHGPRKALVSQPPGAALAARLLHDMLY